MYQLQKLWIIFAVFFTVPIAAQYTGVINSNRPGFSESPYSVGSGVYQLETSIFLRKTRIDPVFSRPQSNGVDFLFRTSFFREKLELNVNFAYQRDQVAFKNIFTSSYFTSGLSKFTVAGKYLLFEKQYKDKSKEIFSWKERHRFDWSRLIPSVAVYAGINTDFVGDIHKTGTISPKVGVLLQNDLTKDLNIITNIFYDKVTTDFPEFSYIVTGTYSFNPRWSTFIENQTIFNKLRVSSNIGSGIAFLYNKNIQVNSSLRFVMEGETPGFYTSFGVSYRLDRHADDYAVVDEYGNKLEEEIITAEPKKKGFFGKLFGKATNIFKKKDKKTAPSEVKLSEKTIQSIRKNTPVIGNDTLARKRPIRTRPKRVRGKPTKKDTKKIEKRKRKDQKRKEKEKKKNAQMSQKQIDRELKKLEKEQRKLERELKKEEEKKKKKKKEKGKEEENG